jgi:LysM repeat protein
MKHAKPSPNKKRIAAAALAVGTTGSIPIVFAGPANAAAVSDIDCKDIGHPVDVTGSDPNNLDADHDGIGCELPATDGATTSVTPTACEDYIVNRGDNLSTIAARYGVALADLEAINPGIIAGDRPDDYSLIFRGGHVHLPDGHCTPLGTVPLPPVGRHDGGHGHHVKVWYRDCTDAPAGLHRGQPGYRHALDMDGDGKACEGPWPPAPPVVTPPVDNPPPVVTPPSDGSLITPAIAPDCPGTVSGYCQHSDVSFWIPIIQQAEQLVPLSGGPQIDQILALIQAESSGDPNAINLDDSNAANGDPSRGLMQTIKATFDYYHVAGTSLNIYDPLANVAAALNYIQNDEAHGYFGIVPGSPY